MISTSSVVIAAWRWRLYWIDSRLTVARVARCIFHCGHLRAESGHVLDQRAIDLHGDVGGQEGGEDFFLVRLIFHRRDSGPAVSALAATTGMIWSTCGSCTSTDLNSL